MSMSPQVSFGAREKVIDDAAMNGPATSSAIDVRSYSILRLDIETTRVAYTTITVTPTQSDDATFPTAGTYAVADIASGGATAAFVSTYTTSASQKYSIMLDVRGLHYVKVAVGGASAGATDKATVYAAPGRGI